jgi:hypothetical protein
MAAERIRLGLSASLRDQQRLALVIIEQKEQRTLFFSRGAPDPTGLRFPLVV